MIAVNLVGRIGNQLFIYALAEALRQRRGRNEKIVFYDKQIVDENWKNSLEDYDIPNVLFVHDLNHEELKKIHWHRYWLWNFYHKINTGTRMRRYKYERLFQPLLNLFGIVACEDGYTRVFTPRTRNIWIQGYFQSERYFIDIAPMIKDTLCSRIPSLLHKDYVKKIQDRHTVCISIKVEHNAGSPLFDVCGKDYYSKAIAYILDNVESPLFFICSDNVPYVLENYINAEEYDYICQESGLSVSDSLSIMSLCKHFIIGNTSFGWWAQYLCSHNNKIVVAPNKWYRTEDLPVDIYQDKWHLIDVSDYIQGTQVSILQTRG